LSINGVFVPWLGLESEEKLLFTTFFLEQPGYRYHMNCVALSSESALRLWDNDVGNVLKKSSEHDTGADVAAATKAACYDQRRSFHMVNFVDRNAPNSGPAE